MDEADGFEIDFLPVGNGNQSGDAIAIRYGTSDNYKILVYDGGTKESGQMLVDHIKKYYHTTFVDYVVSSHPDADHASGLSVVLEQLYVGELWMHQPWKYSPLIREYFEDGRITDYSLAQRLKEKMAAAYNLERLARKNRIPCYEPFCGASVGGFYLMSPEKNWYIHMLIPGFGKSPEQKKSLVQMLNALAKPTAGDMLTNALGDPLWQRGLAGALLSGTGQNALAPNNWKRGLAGALLGGKGQNALSQSTWKSLSVIAETWIEENLRETEETPAENESSVILFGKINGHGILMTGDAGIRALSTAASYADLLGVSLPKEINFIQIPHHGSRHNVSTTVLDRILGPCKLTDDGITTKTAFVSAGKDSNTHPRKMMVNAFKRRGAKVFSTRGKIVRHYRNMQPRTNWGTAKPLPFYYQVEPWD